MRRLLPLALALAFVFAAPALLGCHSHRAAVGVRTSGHSHGHGPPPHAPAHGYRAKHHGHGGTAVELVFDGDLGVYVVVGLDHHYFHDGHYYRLHSGAWQLSVDLDGPWKAASHRSLPRGLRMKAKAGGKHKKHGPPAKHPHR